MFFTKVKNKSQGKDLNPWVLSRGWLIPNMMCTQACLSVCWWSEMKVTKYTVCWNWSLWNQHFNTWISLFPLNPQRNGAIYFGSMCQGREMLFGFFFPVQSEEHYVGSGIPWEILYQLIESLSGNIIRNIQIYSQLILFHYISISPGLYVKVSHKL